MTVPPRIEVRGVVVEFGGVVAVNDISFAVAADETFGVIGPNGAGKTTLLNAISGLVPLRRGVIRVDGTEIQRRRPDRIAGLGVARTFQAAEVFNDFIVTDYLLMGRFLAQPKSLLGAALRVPSVRNAERRDRAAARSLLDEFDLGHLAAERLSALPYGLRKLVDLLRALMGEQRLLLLDEPTSGTASDDRRILREAIIRVRAGGVCVVLVDHDIEFVTALCDRLLVMGNGEELGMGEPSDILYRPNVQAAYVGLEE